MNAHIDPGAAHAVYAPSSAHRWTVCTASATAIAALGEQEEGDEAKEGTAAHEEIERCMSGIAQFSNGCQPLPVDPDHPAAYGVSLVIDYVRQLSQNGSKLWIEQRVALTDQIWGRCDVAHWDEASATLTIVDYKNGFVGVDVEDNEQLQIYAAASIYTHRLPAKWIRLVVVQPRDFRPVPRVKQHIMSAADLFTFSERVAAIPRGPLTFVAGEQCKYCPLFGKCQPTQDILAHLGAAMCVSPENVRPDQVAIFKAMEKPIADYFKSMDKVQTKRALAGHVPPGMKLVATVKHRAWNNETEARAEVVGMFGADALELPTPAQVEKLGMDKVKVATLASTPEGGPALAFVSDKRPAWAQKSVESMFKGAAALLK